MRPGLRGGQVIKNLTMFFFDVWDWDKFRIFKHNLISEREQERQKFTPFGGKLGLLRGVICLEKTII